MRLIDTDNLEKAIAQYFKDHITNNSCTVDAVDCAWDMRRLVEEQPIAYDVDDVVEQLEQEYSKALRHYNEDKGTACSFSSRCRLDAYKKAIEIVKGGGVDA